MGKKAAHPVSSQDDAAEPLPTAGFTRPSPINDGEWTDESGRRWRLRGDGQPIPAKRVLHLLSSEQIRVLLRSTSDWELRDVDPAERADLWRRMSPYLRESVDRTGGDHTEFHVGEFKDEERRTTVIIEEFC